jgi:hypothetical protein
VPVRCYGRRPLPNLHDGGSMKRCPLCERPLPGEVHIVPPLWKKVLQFSDGHRTYRQVARLAGSTRGAVQQAVGHMRRAGIEVKRREKPPERPLDRAAYERLCTFRRDGLTWKKIAERLDMSEAGVFKRAKWLEAVFGKLPGRQKRKNPAQDYVRIRELRVDAQLPWKTVGKMLGMRGQYVARYFRELCKTYT